MVKRLLAGILTVVLLPLGLVFVVLGLVLDPEDMRSGDPKGFLLVGAILAAVGFAFALGFVLLTRAERARKRRRQAGRRARATVIRADFLGGVRVGAWLTYDLAVRLDTGETVERRVLVVPGTNLELGHQVEVLYDPDDPSNFELA